MLPLPGGTTEGRFQRGHPPDRKPQRPVQRGEQGVQLRGPGEVGGGGNRVRHELLREVEEEQGEEVTRRRGPVWDPDFDGRRGGRRRRRRRRSDVPAATAARISILWVYFVTNETVT